MTLAGQSSVDVGNNSGLRPKATLPKLKVKATPVPITSAAFAPWNNMAMKTLHEDNTGENNVSENERNRHNSDLPQRQKSSTKEKKKQ